MVSNPIQRKRKLINTQINDVKPQTKNAIKALPNIAPKRVIKEEIVSSPK